MILSGSVAVPAFAVTVDVLGAFGAGYTVVGLVPSWLAGGFESTALITSQFTATWDNPAPVGGGTLQWAVNTAAAQPVASGCVTAGTLLTRLRAKIRDNVYVGEVAQPDASGKFRVEELYGWMDDGVKALTQSTGWTLDDWWALPQVARQPWYAVDPKWISMRQAFANQYPLTVMLDEGWTIWPNTRGPITQQPLSAFVRKLGISLEVGLFAAPETSDPATTLTAAINAAGEDPILVDAVTDFLSFGYLQIEDELLQYYQVVTSPPSVAVISRGACGTTAAAHALGATVQSCGFWLKGKRLPADIANSQSCVEVPRGWMSHVETYVLSQVRQAQGRHQESERLLASFERACKGIDADPNWKVNIGQRAAYGEPRIGPLYGRSPWGTIVS